MPRCCYPRLTGIPPPETEERWALALEALRGVWASKYNDRAYYSLRKAGLDFDSVRMAVLVQRVVPAQYAFVIHTRNPSNNDEREVFCELVKGLGESPGCRGMLCCEPRRMLGCLQSYLSARRRPRPPSP